VPVPPAPRDPAPDLPDAGSLDAGELGDWLVEVQAAIAGEQPSDVPCDGCTACCTSSQFIHIGPDETDTLAHVPAALRFPAPGLPAGHVLLGYDERGHCPMLVDGACSIYAHRPRTCRSYDCRVFAAASVSPAEVSIEIARRSERWRFRLAGDADRVRLQAIHAAATFLREHGPDLESRSIPVPDNPTQLAVLAVELHELFVDGSSGAATAVEPALGEVADAIASVRASRPSS
jgi:Fe-S-cluster containining protein